MDPTRMLIVVKGGNLVWQEAWDTPQTIITRVLKHLEYDSLVSPDDNYSSPDCRLVAVERWDSMIFIICDLYHQEYDWNNAHKDGMNELPVRQVNVGGDDEHVTIKARTHTRRISQVDRSLRDLHDKQGWKSKPPYRVDHAHGKYPVYREPRSQVLQPQVATSLSTKTTRVESNHIMY